MPARWQGGPTRASTGLVGIAPRETLAGCDEVEFVAVWPITVDHDQQEDGECSHHRPDLQDCKLRSLGPLHPTILSELLAPPESLAVNPRLVSRPDQEPCC